MGQVRAEAERIGRPSYLCFSSHSLDNVPTIRTSLQMVGFEDRRVGRLRSDT